MDKQESFQEALKSLLPLLTEGATFGVVPISECKRQYSEVCSLLGVSPDPSLTLERRREDRRSQERRNR